MTNIQRFDLINKPKKEFDQESFNKFIKKQQFDLKKKLKKRKIKFYRVDFK